MRVARGEVEVVGSADPVYLRDLAGEMADVRDALSAIVPATRRVAAPVTVIVECASTDPSAITERPWRIYILGRCAPIRDDEGDAPERYARMVLRRSVQSLPLWLEVGVARLAMAAERTPDGRFQFAKFAAADVRGYREPPLPPRAVFSARRTSEVWQHRQRRAAFVRQALVYVHRVVQQGDIGACTSNADDRGDPAARLRTCLGSDIDPFHEVAMSKWPEGLPRVMVGEAVDSSRATEHSLSEAERQRRLADAWIATGRVAVARRRLAESGLTAESGGSVAGLLARIAEASGERARARALFEVAVAGDLTTIDRYHYAAALLAPVVQAGSLVSLAGPDATRAGSLLDDLERSHPFADVFALQGIARLATGDHSRAIQSLWSAVDASWDEAYALWLARAYAAGRLTASARRLAHSLRASSESAEVQNGAERLLRELPADEGDAVGVPVLPPLLSGEQRTRGRLLTIDCADDWVSLVVETPIGSERFVSARLSLVRFVSFRRSPVAATCGSRSDPEPVIVNWRAVPNQPRDATGVASAVSFLER
jgi:tetratricopeptide (TPR) repeat protein